MHVTGTMLWLPKDGNTPDEYEDAAHPSDAVDDPDCDSFRCAVADGATETSFSRLWAGLLVRGYVEEEPLEVTRKKWHEEIPTEDLPWYAEEKASAGAYAALVGLRVLKDGAWECEAVGDSCMIQTRYDKIILAFPLQSPDQFNNSPALICSKANPATDVEFLKLSGSWEIGDKFFLLTDAIARWIVSGAEAEVNQLWSLENETALRAFVSEQRALIDADGRPKLHNDDLTILRLEIR
jgi:hypothetical protein